MRAPNNKHSHKTGKKNRKHGRHSRRASDAAYKAERRWEKNKIRKMKKHIKKHPNSAQAKRDLERVLIKFGNMINKVPNY